MNPACHHRHVALVGSVSVLIAAGCGPKPVATTPAQAERKLTYQSAQQPPDWTTREPASDQQYHYFRGIRTGAASLEGGETDARQNALQKIVEFLGLRVTVDYQRLRTDEQTAIQDAIHSVGGADVFGTRAMETFYRQYRIREVDGETHDVFDVYVLVRFPLESVERIRRNQQEWATSIRQMIGGPGSMARPQEIYQQVTRCAQAVQAIDRLNGNVLATMEMTSQADELRRQAMVQLTRVIGSFRLAVSTSRPRVQFGPQDTTFSINVQVTTEQQGATVPVSNVPVRITCAGRNAADSSQVVWSDESGVAAWALPDIPFSIGPHELTARVDLPVALQPIGDLMRIVPVASGTMEVISPEGATRLLLVVEERVGDQRAATRDAENRLAEALKQAGFQVIGVPAGGQYGPGGSAGDPWASQPVAMALAERSGATHLVFGQISTDQPVAMSYGSQTFATFWCSARVNLSLLKVPTGENLGSVVLPDNTFRDTRGFGNSPERAVAEALKLERYRGQPTGYVHIASAVQQSIRRR